MTTNSRAVHMRIYGLVQGVGYRAWLYGTATGLGLSGWVRNRRDDTVEAVIAGSSDAVEEMIRMCRRGPRAAVVDRVEIISEAAGGFEGFEIRPTE